ncbi:MAG TPA: zinc dependent phospholipase C family protein [Bryobacteraceae bacterium]|nr:zinc dependent phospholipase C family protein [Bryobacteraceae bacterium]
MREAILFLLLFLFVPQPGPGYAVLTHEAIIDSAWDHIRPILLKRFSGATPEQIKQAYAYVYGGCILQDMGYYPLGSKYFSDLVHYVRSGDFVLNLLRDAEADNDINEFAFALGALAHYAADTVGHPVAVNRAVAISYPKLRKKFGNAVTYAEDPVAHLKAEFGFDVVEVAKGRYANIAFHDFIGFQVSKNLLERAFRDTYALELKDQFTSLDLALGTYRRTVSSIIPEATKIAWSLKKEEIVRSRPGITRRRFLYNLSRSAYEREWGRDYRRPGWFARFMAFLLRLIPNFGPFKSISFKPPTPRTENLFMESFNQTLTLYRAFLREAEPPRLRLANLDFDTGRPTRAGEYPLADKAYARLLRDLAHQGFKNLSPELRDQLLAFYRNPESLTHAPRKEKKQDRLARQDTRAALEKLRALEGKPAQSGRP